MSLAQSALPPMNTAPAGSLDRDLPAGFEAFYRPLHERFTPRQQELAAARIAGMKASHEGRLPTYASPSQATTEAWKIELPSWIRDQRNQMTGPADEADLIVKMLNSGAPGVMLDLEDSMANDWAHTLLGVSNVVAALYGELTYEDKKRGGTVAIKPSSTVTFTRVRGLHLSQAGVLEDVTSASLFDLALLVYQLDFKKLKHPLCVYIPKSEAAVEGLWWRDVLQTLAEIKGEKRDYIKCMALCESHAFAYQFEEFAYNLREHLIGINLGRWDYMASLIHFNLNDAAWVLPDRNTIPHDVPFFQNLRTLIPSICHKHNMFAIGGMTALFPSRDDAELNDRALKALAVDKKNEANCFMDGAWTGHPDQNAIAVEQFPAPNQFQTYRDGFEAHPDLRPSVVGVGKTTIDGTRAAVRTVIRYRNGYINGKGASLLDGFMEDLATDRIYRLMIAQRIKHGMHTASDVRKLFDEELEKLIASGKEAGTAQTLREARTIGEAMIEHGAFDPV
ncbi:MAG: malate synthase A [Vulcanimicrobiaceae bacterium]